MPSVSAKQEKFMRAVANSPKFAKKVGVPQSVGKEFEMKDKEMKDMKKMGRGMAKADMAKKGMKGYKEGGMPMVMKDGKKVPSFAADGKGKMAKGGKVHSDVKMDKAMMKKMVEKHASKPASKAHKGLKSGGLAAGHKQADGVATKGKTRGMEVKMMNGGMPKTRMMRAGGKTSCK